MERDLYTAVVPVDDLVRLVKAEAERDLYANRAEDLENQLLEAKAKMAEYALIDQWFAACSWNKDVFKAWAAKQGLDEQAAEIERLNGENEELRRGMDELGAQVEYWRMKAEKAGVDDDKME